MSTVADCPLGIPLRALSGFPAGRLLISRAVPVGSPGGGRMSKRVFHISQSDGDEVAIAYITSEVQESYISVPSEPVPFACSELIIFM